MIYTLHVTIALIPFEIISYRKSLNTFLSRYFSSYHTVIEPVFSIIIDSNGPGTDSISEQIIPELQHRDPGVFSIIDNALSGNSIGLIDIPSKRCTLYISVFKNMYLLTSAIRICIQFFLERNDGFFLHAASGMVKGKGVIFTGESTAGKSTALQNLKPDNIVSEDAAAIRFIENSAFIFSIPFKGDRSTTAPLDYICFPRKWTEKPQLQRIKSSDMILEITANTLFSAPSCDDIMNTVLSTIHLCSNTVQGYNCLFYKTTNLSSVFDDYGLFN